MENGGSKKYYILALIFGCYVLSLLFIFSNFPEFTQEQKDHLRYPRNMKDVKYLGRVLSQYTDTYYYTVMAAFMATYTFLQTFSIPGTIFLTFLGGSLFGLPMGVLVGCTCGTIGASNCYLLSYYVGRSLAHKFFPQRLDQFGKEVEKHQKNLLNYLLFLRFTPVIPNWFINIAAPLFNVPLKTFALATFFGVMPQTFVAVKAGLTLQEVESASDIFDMRLILTLFGLALVSILPTLQPIRSRIDKMLNKKTE